MKKNFIKSFLFAAAAVLTMTFTACSSDVENFNTPNDNDIEIPKGKTLFSSGDMTGMPVINADADGEAKAMLLNGDGTRTSMGGKAVNQKFPFYWEPGDRIWVKNSNYRRSSATGITSTQPSAQFMLDGTPPFTASRYEVYYVGQNSPQAASETANALQVTIADQQVQSAWNKSEHLGTSGDCGSCYANLQGNGSYTFSMDHKASYLIFYPYLHTALQNDSYTLQKIEIYSDAGGSNIAGTYDFTFTDGLADIPQAGTAKQEITLTCGDAFGLTTAVPDLTDNNTVYNHCFVVIAPGTHQLTIRYTMKNASGTEFSFIKDISLKQYAENSVYTFIHELRYAVVSYGFKYYERTLADPSNIYRWGATIPSTQAGGEQNQTTSTVTAGFWANIPNFNASTWYAKAGVFWDNSTEWILIKRDGTEVVCRSGAWLKKKDHISGFSNTTHSGQTAGTPVVGRPDASIIDQYFFIPSIDYENSPGVYYRANGPIRLWESSPQYTNTAWTFEISSQAYTTGAIYLKSNTWLCYPLSVDGTPWFQ